jgi:hypothetical protein
MRRPSTELPERRLPICASGERREVIVRPRNDAYYAIGGDRYDNAVNEIAIKYRNAARGQKLLNELPIGKCRWPNVRKRHCVSATRI